MAAGCPGAAVGGHQARNPDRRAQGNSRRPSGQGPGARLSNGFAAQGPPASAGSPRLTLPPPRPHRRANSNHHAAATPAPDHPHPRGISRAATIPRVRRLSTLRPGSLPSRPGRTAYRESQSGGSRAAVVASPITLREHIDPPWPSAAVLQAHALAACAPPFTPVRGARDQGQQLRLLLGGGSARGLQMSPSNEPTGPRRDRLLAASTGVLAGQRGGGCEIRTREGLPPTRFPTMLASVHRRPPPSANCTNTIRANTGERSRTGVNETETETGGQAALHGAARLRSDAP
jgi:hypothetical protein